MNWDHSADCVKVKVNDACFQREVSENVGVSNNMGVCVSNTDCTSNTALYFTVMVHVHVYQKHLL